MSYLTGKHMPRRTFIRGAMGAAVALPFLDAMVAAKGGAKAPDKPWEGADTLEWTLPSPPPYHSFVTPPVVK